MIDLYYQTVTAAIRKEQVGYLYSQRALPFQQELPEVEEISSGEYARLRWRQKRAYRRMLRKQKRAYNKALRRQKRPVDEQLTKGYNAGIEMALKVLRTEHAKFCKMMKDDEL